MSSSVESLPGGPPAEPGSAEGELFTGVFQVRLELFDGPIDLLLHLVKQHELPIEKLSLAQIADQYFACVESMRHLDLEIAGEYLVIAATLLSIKSSVLLNDPVELVTDDEGNLVDPHEELLRRLREAAVYREGAASLSCRELLGIDVFSPPSSLAEFTPPPAALRQHDPILLGKVFRRMLERAGADAAEMTIRFDGVPIVERMSVVLDVLRRSGGRRMFSQLVPDLTSRVSVIATFIALLELCKRQAIHVEQTGSFEDIAIVLSGENFDPQSMSSEFDLPTTASANG